MNIYIFVCFVLLIFVIIKILNRKTKKRVLKCQKTYFLAKPKKMIFTSICLMLNYFGVKDYKEFKSLSILKQLDHILSCVLYKTPVTYNLEIDKTILKNFGVDINLPIFYVKEYNKTFLKGIMLSKKYVKFNLIFNEENFIMNKKLNKIKYFLLNTNFASVKLLNNIFALNINTPNKFKVKKVENINQIEIKNNKKVLIANSKIENNFLCDVYNNNNVNIEIKKCVNSGEYLYFKIVNKSETIQNIELSYNYKLEDKYFAYTKQVNGLLVKNILSNQNLYICNDFNIKCFYPNNMREEISLPFLKMYKCFNIAPKTEKNFVLYIGNKKINKTNLKESYNLYNKKINEIVNFKIKCQNKTLEYLVNFYLPNRIILEDVDKTYDLNIDNFEECYFLFKQKKLSNLNFYFWLKHYYIGIVEDKNFIKIDTKLKEDFTLYYKLNHKTKEIQVKNNANFQKYMIVSGVKFYNCNLITKQNLDTIDKLTLVV